jgi:hypothetical protein
LTKKRYVRVSINDSGVTTIVTPLGMKDQTMLRIMGTTEILTTYDDEEINIIVERTKKKPIFRNRRKRRNDFKRF